MLTFKKILRKNKWIIILLIFALGAFLRFFELRSHFMYGHDHDLASWIVKDILVDKHWRLIGQETSTQGIFIGPLYYYLQIPFFLLFKMNPIAQAFMSSLIGLFGIFSAYYIFSRVFDKNTGYISSFLYSVSFYMVNNDREAVPTMPVIIWSMWFFYGIDLVLKGKQRRGYVLLGLLIGLIWHLNLALVILVPLILIAQLFSKKKPGLKNSLLGVFSMFIPSLPLIIFEIRHNFLQTRSFITSLVVDQGSIVHGWAKVRRVIYILSKNISGFLFDRIGHIPFELGLVLMIILFIFLVYRKLLDKEKAIILSLWFILYFAFFSSYSKIVSEYYLNGVMVIWIILFALWIAYLWKGRKYKVWVIIILSFFGIMNVYKFLTWRVSGDKYVNRRDTVVAIKEDAEKRQYPCVAISYITNPGYNLGYRYLFYLEDLFMKRVDSGVPVYTIIFPLGKDSVKEDARFGGIGLIYPDYEKYNEESIKKSCQGGNVNLTGSMFGFTR